jgi:hypothetical protein
MRALFYRGIMGYNIQRVKTIEEAITYASNDKNLGDIRWLSDEFQDECRETTKEDAVAYLEAMQQCHQQIEIISSKSCGRKLPEVVIRMKQHKDPGRSPF